MTLFEELTKDVVKQIDTQRKIILALRESKKKLVRLEKLFPSCPEKGYHVFWWSRGCPFIYYIIPWDKVMADKLAIELTNAGWIVDHETDNKEDGEYKFYFKHPDWESAEACIEMEAKRAGSKCRLVQIGEQVQYKPRYKVICEDAEI